MGLRDYLVKRAAQTFVTIIVVLALMFVLFRLMPGDPVSLAISPGLTPIQREEQRVALGFARWESAPGVFKRGGFTVADPGLYAVDINIVDTSGNEETLYAAYVRPKIFPSGSPIIVVRTIAEPSMHVITGTEVRIFSQVVTSDPLVELSSLMAWAIVEEPDTTTLNVTLSPEANGFAGTVTPADPGVYRVDIGILDPATGDFASAPFGFATNLPAESIAPFYYVEDEGPEPIFTGPSAFTPTLAEVTVIVLSSEADMEEILLGTVVTPRDTSETFEVDHPIIAVDRPDYEEFWFYMAGMLTGNFGTSFFSGRPITAEIGERIGPTLLLFGSATIISIVLGIGGGVLLAWFRGSKGEVLGIVAGLFFYSMPIFWFGLVLLFAFAANLALFPLGGIGCINVETGQALEGLACTGDILWHMALPLITLVVVSLAGYVLLMRNSLLEVLGEDFITVARAKGLRERTVMYKHAARNALLPVTTVAAIAMATVISGGVLTETIFSWPGMGFYLVQRTLNQDFPAVQAAFFILALLTIIANVVADVAYAYLDPRVRL